MSDGETTNGGMPFDNPTKEPAGAKTPAALPAAKKKATRKRRVNPSLSTEPQPQFDISLGSLLIKMGGVTIALDSTQTKRLHEYIENNT